LAAEPTTFFSPTTPPRSFSVVAHRGGLSQAPENTRADLVRAISDGFDWIEIDVRRTKDGKHILYQPDQAAPSGGQPTPVREMTYESLRKIDVGAAVAERFAGEPILAFDDALRLAKGSINLLIDCKEVDAESLGRQIVDAKMEKQVVVAGDPAVLEQIRKASGGKVAILARWNPSTPLEEWVGKLRPNVVELSADEATSQRCRLLHSLGTLVEVHVAGPSDDAKQWDRLLADGVDWIQTDKPEELIAQQILQRRSQRTVRVCHHRGSSWFAPENTLPAYRKAIALGADYVEFDVRTTSDGKLFLLHDARLDRTTNGRGAISARSAAEVAALDAGSWYGKAFAKERVPTLDEFLQATKGKVLLYFDAKSIAPEALVDALRRNGVVEQTIVYQGRDYLAKLRALEPKLKIMPSLSNPKEVDELARTLKPDAVDARWGILSKELIDQCHAHGIAVFSDALGLNERIEKYQQAIGWGIDVIQTDRPIRVLRAIELMENQK
jgi:glycerophosphoryl diester phosphodiesterase